MSTRYYHWLCFALLAFLTLSCNNDDTAFRPTNTSTTDNEFGGYGINFAVEDATLSFSSVNDFTQFYEAATRNGDAAEDELDRLIDRVMAATGFSSLHPHTEDTQLSEQRLTAYVEVLEARAALIEEVYETATSDDLEFAEYIADPTLASLLNLDGDIRIGDVTYHYTPFGLFAASTTAGENAFKTIIRTDSDIKAFLRAHAAAKGHFVDVAPGLQYFVADVTPFSKITGLEELTPVDDASKDLDELQLTMCGGQNNNTIWTSIFGPSADCTDYFASNRRIKTKIWNQNYGLFASLGTNVRSQRRRFRVWWASSVDELELGTGFFNYEFQLPDPPAPPSMFGGPGILAARYADGTMIGFNGQILNSGPLFDRMRSIGDNLPFLPVVDEDWVQLRFFVNLGFIQFDQTFSAADYLDFRNMLDDFLEDQVPDLLRQAGNIPDQMEMVQVDARRMQVAADILDRNRRNIANMKHYFAFNTGQIGISGNPSVSGGIGLDLSNIMNAYDYETVRGLVYGAGRRGGSVRGNWVGMEQDN